jgi:hypothetical protein
MDDDSSLPLFSGPHLARFRFEKALDRLDLAAAVEDAPPEWRDDVARMAGVLKGRSPARVDLDALLRCRQPTWPPVLETTWQRLVGRRLDAHGIPRTLDGEPAAAFLLRGGEEARAEQSLRRHLSHHRRDVRAWELMARFAPALGAARCAFHGGPVLDAAGRILDLIREDEIEPPGPWLLPYAWLTRDVDLGDIRDALEAEAVLSRPPLTIPGDARAFAWYLLDAGGRPFGRDSVGVVEARERLQRISPVAFRRYLARI